MLDGCIERLGCTPDIFYRASAAFAPAHRAVHRVDPQTPIEETVKAMDEGRKAGKFRYLGISEMSAETLERAAKTVKVDVIQIEYSPWSTDIERNVRRMSLPVLADADRASPTWPESTASPSSRTRRL